MRKAKIISAIEEQWNADQSKENGMDFAFR